MIEEGKLLFQGSGPVKALLICSEGSRVIFDMQLVQCEMQTFLRPATTSAATRAEPIKMAFD